jgi:putative ABC transport system permease protein
MLANYLRIAWKVLSRRRFYTAISLAGVSLTLLVLLVATAVLDSVFGAAAPEVNADRTLGIYDMTMSSEHWTTGASAGYGFLDREARGIAGVERLAIVQKADTVVSFVDGRKISSYLKRTNGDYWQVLRFDFLEGGPFTDADDRAGNAVAVINATTRRRFFDGQPALGRSLEADGQTFRIVGVVPDVSFMRMAGFADIWVPIGSARATSYRTQMVGDFNGLLLAESRADFPRIKDEVQARLRRVQLPEPGTELHGGADTLFESVSRTLFSRQNRAAHPGRLWLLLAGVALLFMTLPALNLVNINLSRILERISEIGVRRAFGAPRRALIVQFLVENIVLTLIGAGIGLALAAGALAALNRSGVAPYSDFAINFRVFAWAVGLSLVFAVLSGVLPAWRMSRLDPVAALRGRSL